MVNFQLSKKFTPSSLHNIIFKSFLLVLVLWSLLQQSFIFLSYIIVVQKKILVEIESSHCVGGALTFFTIIALFSKIYLETKTKVSARNVLSFSY